MIFKNINIGTDPEVFLYDKNLHKCVSSEGIIPGTKEDPHVITDKGHKIQLDNVLTELNVPAAKCPDEMYRSIQFVIYYIGTMIPKHLTVSIVPSAVLSPEELTTPQAMEFGCEPDFNAWTGVRNTKPQSENGLRTAGGHIHVSYDNPETEKSLELIRTMDLFLGVPSLFLDKDAERRKMYGQAGAFRLPDYGLEYRTLSNFWIRSPNTIKWIFKGIHNAIQFLAGGDTISVTDGELIQKAINENNEEVADGLLKKFRISQPSKRARSVKRVAFA